MRNMFTAVAALTLLAVGNAARGVQYCSSGPSPFTPHHAWPECENWTIRVYGAELDGVSVQDTTGGIQLSIRAAYNGDMEVYEGVQIEAPGVGFDLIEIAPCDGCGPAQANKKVDLSFPSSGAPVAYINNLRDSFDPATGGVVRLHLDGGANLPLPDVSGTVGNIASTDVVNFRIGGDLGYIDEDPTTVLFRGRVDSLHVAGDLLAQFVVRNNGDYSEQDSIIDLTIGGDIGVPDPTNATEEHAGRIATKNRIRTITARNVYGYIWPGEIDAYSYKSIHRLRVVKDEFGGGDFFGTLYANTISDFHGEAEVFGQISVQGDYGGTVLLTQPLKPRQNDVDPPRIVVDGSMVEGIRFHSRIVLPQGGLEGQIVVNRANDGGAWDQGIVFVGDVELETSDYSTLPSALGGGLVGLAPFDLHCAACNPPHQTTVYVQPSATCLVECEYAQTCSIKACYVQHYGPVVNFGTTMPVEVSIKPVDESYGWFDVTSQYKATIVSDGTFARLKIERNDAGGFPTDYHYRITPKPDVLRCRFVEDEPDVQDYIYYFTIELDCGLSLLLESFDLNQNDAIDSGDIAAWVVEPVDLNEDDAADSADLDLLIDAVNLYGDN